jgi:hypothetical protein
MRVEDNVQKVLELLDIDGVKRAGQVPGQL